MKTVEDEVQNLYDWVVEELPNLEILNWGNEYSISVGDNDKNLSIGISKCGDWPRFANYDIHRIRGMQTHGRYKKCSKLIKKIYDIVDAEYKVREAKRDNEFFRDYINEIVNYDPQDEDFDFGEPMHTENLPDCPLEVGKTYLVPLKLLAKERRFDGGRGSEFYKFNYQTEDYGYRPFSIIDYNMSKEIQPMVDADVIAEALSNPIPISEELKEKVKESASKTTFC